MTFNKTYFHLFFFVLLIEICIAVFLKTGFIRHTFGDFLVVILLYCFLKSFWDAKPLIVGLTVLAIAFFVEFLQLTPLLELANLEKNRMAKIVFGSTFSVGDLFAYTLGIGAILLVERKIKPLWKP